MKPRSPKDYGKKLKMTNLCIPNHKNTFLVCVETVLRRKVQKQGLSNFGILQLVLLRCATENCRLGYDLLIFTYLRPIGSGLLLPHHTRQFSLSTETLYKYLCSQELSSLCQVGLGWVRLSQLITSFPRISSCDPKGPRTFIFITSSHDPIRPHIIGNVIFCMPEKPLLGPNLIIVGKTEIHSHWLVLHYLNCVMYGGG